MWRKEGREDGIREKEGRREKRREGQEDSKKGQKEVRMGGEGGRQEEHKYHQVFISLSPDIGGEGEKGERGIGRRNEGQRLQHCPAFPRMT